jgi:hypothetical protein
MGEKGEKNLLHFLEKKKGEELTKGNTGTRHPLPFSETATRGVGTVTGGAPAGLEHPLPLAGVGGGLVGQGHPLPPVGLQ